jgi:hypothetical protein
MENDVKPSASAEVIRWSVNRKKKVVLQMMHGEPIGRISVFPRGKTGKIVKTFVVFFMFP